MMTKPNSLLVAVLVGGCALAACRHADDGSGVRGSGATASAAAGNGAAKDVALSCADSGAKLNHIFTFRPQGADQWSVGFAKPTPAQSLGAARAVVTQAFQDAHDTGEGTISTANIAIQVPSQANPTRLDLSLKALTPLVFQGSVKYQAEAVNGVAAPLIDSTRATCTVISLK